MTARSPALLVLALALAARLVYVAAQVEVPAQDTPDYDEIAANVLSGEGFVSHDTFFGYPMRSWRAPLYPGLLALIYGIFGFHHLAVQLFQCLLGAGTAVGVFYLARRLHPPSALLTGLLAALYPPLVTNAAEVMTETLFTACLVGAALLGLRRDDRSFNFWGAGVMVGLATLTRPVGLLLAPALVVPQLLRAWQQEIGPSTAWRRCGMLLVGLLLTLAPWTIRNALVHEAFVPVSTHGGFILARSNADAPDWRRDNGWQIHRQTFAQTPNEVERDRAWRQQGIDWIIANPLSWLHLTVERFLRFWYVFRPDYNIGFALLVPAVLVGVIRFGRCEPYREITLFAGMSILLFSTLLYGSTRFRLPLEAFFLLYAGPVLHAAWVSDRRRRWLGWGGTWGILQLVTWWQQDSVRAAVLEILHRLGLK